MSDGNITRVITNRRKNDLDVRNSTTLIYSNWSPWSRCEDCLQTRMKKCISPKCRDNRYLEEKSCTKKRCVRKNNLKSSRNELHVVREIQVSGCFANYLLTYCYLFVITLMSKNEAFTELPNGHNLVILLFCHISLKLSFYLEINLMVLIKDRINNLLYIQV